MGESDEKSVEELQTVHRFGILDPLRTNVIATVSITSVNENGVNATISAEETLRTQLADIVGKAGQWIQATRHPEQNGFALFIEELRKSLDLARLQWCDLPEADANFTFEFDVFTGQIISKETLLHDFAQPASDLMHDIQTSLREALSRHSLDLADKVMELCAAGEFNVAAVAILKARDDGQFFSGIPQQLLVAAQAIDANSLPPAERSQFLQLRFAFASAAKDYVAAEPDIRNLLAEDVGIDPKLRQSLQTSLGIAEVRKGHTEAALSIWHNVLADDEGVEPGARGWLWRNIAKSLRFGEEAIRAARLSADAFLEAGDRREAGASYMLESQMLEYTSPMDALNKLDDILSITTHGGLIGDQLLAGIHHAKATRLLELRRGIDALDEATKAINLRRGIIGAENELISSLHVAAIAGRIAEQPSIMQKYQEEADLLETQTGSEYFRVANQIANLIHSYDSHKAQDLLEYANSSKSLRLKSAVTIAIALGDETLDNTGRMAKIEALIRDMTNDGANEGDLHICLVAMATILRQSQHPDRAIPYLERAHLAKPLDLPTVKSLAQAYQHAENWDKAAVIYKRLIDLFGLNDEMVLLYCQALIKSGSASEAIAPLQEFLNRENLPPDIIEFAKSLQTRAIAAWTSQGQPAALSCCRFDGHRV